MRPENGGGDGEEPEGVVGAAERRWASSAVEEGIAWE